MSLKTFQYGILIGWGFRQSTMQLAIEDCILATKC